MVNVTIYSIHGSVMGYSDLFRLFKRKSKMPGSAQKIKASLEWP